MLFPKELVAGEAVPEVMLFIEFDDSSSRVRQRKTKRAERILEAVTEQIMITEALETQEKLWALRHSAATIVNYESGGKTTVPIIEDAVVPVERLPHLVQTIYSVFEKHHLSVAVWGHAGDANLHVQPLMDLSKVGDRQAVFKLMDEYYRAVVQLGGSIAAEHNEGRIWAPFVKLQTGEDVVHVYEQLKQGFDSYNILNPGVKTGTDIKKLVEIMRKNYSLSHLAEHLPRT